MRYGIPVYRLPRNILDAEIARITDMGVTIECNKRIDDVMKAKEEGSYDAVIMCMGASLSSNVDIPSADTKHVLHALEVLQKISSTGDIQIGKKVAVYGGGNTAVDVARSLLRIGADPIIVYRRNRDKMPANPEEMDGAIEEGIQVKWLTTITEAKSKDNFKIEKMALDENGRPKPTGEYDELTADDVVLAIGQNVDLSVVKKIDGIKCEKDAVIVDQNNFMTDVAGSNIRTLD